MLKTDPNPIELKLLLTRSFTSFFTLCFSHIPRYVSSTAEQNLTQICAPALTFLIE